MSNMAPPIRATKDELDPKTASNILGVTEQLLKEVETTKKDISIMQACLKELDALVKKLGPNWNVRPFGSAANGFCTRFSDLDVTCYQSPPKKELSANECIALLHPFLKEHGSFEVHEIISTARIPILKTRFDGKLDVDLSFQNTEPLPNTQLMRAYARLSPTIRQLGILVKLWANAEGVCGAQDGHLSSYSLTIMVLYCLQVDQYVKMPCFPTWEFTGHKRLPDCTNNVKWVCELPLASLLYRFFDFYASRHCWGYEVVSPRVGQRLYAGDATFQALQGRDSNMMIHIEDPFLSTRNLNCVLGQAQQRLLYEKLASAHADLQHGKVPVGFLMALQKCTRTNPKKELEAPTTKKDMKAAPIAQETDANSIAKSSIPAKDAGMVAVSGGSDSTTSASQEPEPEDGRSDNDARQPKHILQKSQAAQGSKVNSASSIDQYPAEAYIAGGFDIPYTPYRPDGPSAEAVPMTSLVGKFSKSSRSSLFATESNTEGGKLGAEISDGTTWTL
jgi:DNA polymerase sigma